MDYYSLIKLSLAIRHMHTLANSTEKIEYCGELEIAYLKPIEPILQVVIIIKNSGTKQSKLLFKYNIHFKFSHHVVQGN